MTFKPRNEPTQEHSYIIDKKYFCAFIYTHVQYLTREVRTTVSPTWPRKTKPTCACECQCVGGGAGMAGLVCLRVCLLIKTITIARTHRHTRTHKHTYTPESARHAKQRGQHRQRQAACIFFPTLRDCVHKTTRVSHQEHANSHGMHMLRREEL